MCDCIDEINSGLAEHNGKLDVPYIINLKTGKPVLPHRVQIQTYKLETKKRGQVPALCAEYCPFCGDRYVWPDPKEMSDGQLRAELKRAARQTAVLEEKHREFRIENVERGALAEELP